MASPNLSSALSLRVAAVWGTTVVRTMELASGQSCVLGDAVGALIPMPDDLFASNTPVRAVSDGWEVDSLGATGGAMQVQGVERDRTRIAAGEALRLRPGDYGLLQYGQLSVFFQLGFRALPLPEVSRKETLVTLAMLLSVAVHVGLFAAAFVLTRSPPIPKPAELSSQGELAARFRVASGFIFSSTMRGFSERVDGAPGQLAAADLQSDVDRAVSMIKSVGPSGAGRKTAEPRKAAAAVGRKVIASAGTGTAQGGLAKEKVRQVVTLNIAPLQICYENEVQRVADLKGDVSIAWQIAADGSVTASSVSRSSLGLAKAESCMLRQVNQWRFPPSATATNVTWPFSFALAD